MADTGKHRQRWESRTSAGPARLLPKYDFYYRRPALRGNLRYNNDRGDVFIYSR
jgi:hypothetical protein